MPIYKVSTGEGGNEAVGNGTQNLRNRDLIEVKWCLFGVLLESKARRHGFKTLQLCSARRQSSQGL